MVKRKFQNLLIILFISMTMIFNHFQVIYTLRPNMLLSNYAQLFEEDEPQVIQKNIPNLQINNLTRDTIEYYVEQGVKFELKTNESKEMLTTSETNVSITSEVLNSSFQLLSTGNNCNDWFNETKYGDVNVSTILVENEEVFRLHFSNKSNFNSGVNNSKFLVSSSPNLVSFPTIISFKFRIPLISPELLSSPHTLSLDFKFNNGIISFILSNQGETYSGDGFEELENNVIFDNKSSSIYILCNETAPFSWRNISHNITRLITTYLPPEEFSNFLNLQSLFCHTIAYIPYNLSLDINNLKYFTYLPCPSIDYTIGETEISTVDGTLAFNSIMENFTLSASENSSWKNNTITYIEVNLIRVKLFESSCVVKEWNETKIRVNMILDIPDILEYVSSSNVHILLPSDWINITLLNESVDFMFFNKTKMLNTYLLGKFYQINVSGIVRGTLEAWTPNYVSNIIVPTDVCRNEVIQIRGELRYPFSEDIHLYLQNESFCYHQTTLPMINSTFIFPEITITEQFPLGILQLSLNWSNSWEFGIFEQLIYVHQQESPNSLILFHSSQNVFIYQFESFMINISLFQNGEKYSTNSTIVLLMKGSDCLFFSRSSDNEYILNISHVIWDPGIYNIDLFAFDGSLFFAKEILNLTIKPASIFWSFENLPCVLEKNDSVNFRLYSYINPQGDDYYLILSGLTIRIWINATIISSYITNADGLVDIFFDLNYSSIDEYLQVTVEGMLEGETLKLQTLMFLISNETNLNDGDRAYITEIMRSPVKANKTFFVYYNVEYSNNNLNWFVPVESFQNIILSGYIMRDNYIIGTTIVDHLVTWKIEANQSNNDILVLELPCPTLFVIKETVSKKFRLELTVYSQLTINNYSMDINLRFLGFPFSNLSLFDSLNRNITNLFPIAIEEGIVSLFQFNIISGFEIRYFLEGYLLVLDIALKKPFQSSYIYNESIIGSWRIYTPVDFSFKVLYSILGLGSWECYNTSLEVLPNSTSVITAVLPPQSWNNTISIQLVVSYLSNLTLVSSSQNFTIYDPFPPTLDYSIEFLVDNTLRIHAFVFEPEKASGIKNITLLMNDQNKSATSLSLNHYCFDISKNAVQTPIIKVVDWANNEKFLELTNLNSIISESPSLLKLMQSQYLLPLLSSITLIGGIFISRIIKKRRATIF
ncbi:MAG: hypothetical protein ACFFC6_07015 [Promethearchaeota archaeon]